MYKNKKLIYNEFCFYFSLYANKITQKISIRKFNFLSCSYKFNLNEL